MNDFKPARRRVTNGQLFMMILGALLVFALGYWVGREIYEAVN